MVFAILSFLNAVFLPGAVAYGIYERVCRQDFTLGKFIVFSFIVSCCFNFGLIYLLVGASIYTRNIVIAIFALEILAFLYLFKDRIFKAINPPKILLDSTRGEKILFLISILIALYFLNKCFKADIFIYWDAVVSWDRWASEWARGKFVLNEGGYSQLYPMLLSLGYVASGQISSFQGVGVAIYWYFMFVGIVASLFLLKDSEVFGRRFSTQNYFGIMLCVMIYMTFFRYSNEFYVGYVDMPCAMMILISAVCVIKAKALLNDICHDSANADSNNAVRGLCENSIDLTSSSLARTAGGNPTQSHNAKSRNDSIDCHESQCYFLKAQSNAMLFLLLGSLSAGISTEIKQAGLFWCGIYAIALIIFFRNLGLKRLLLNLAIMLTFLAPWVIIAMHKKLILHTPATNIEYTWDRIYLGKGYLERFELAINRYKKFAYAFLLCVLTLGIRNRIFALFGISAIIYFVFWGTHLSYDLRNLQGGLALMIVSIGAIVVYYFEWLLKILPFLCKRVGAIFCVFVICGLIIAYFSEERTLKNEYKRKMKLGGESTNALVFNAFKNYGSKIVLTNNQLIAYVPAFDRKYYKHYSFGEHRKDGEFERDALDLKQREGSFYVLLPIKEYERYKDFFKDARLLGKSDYYALVDF